MNNILKIMTAALLGLGFTVSAHAASITVNENFLSTDDAAYSDGSLNSNNRWFGHGTWQVDSTAGTATLQSDTGNYLRAGYGFRKPTNNYETDTNLKLGFTLGTSTGTGAGTAPLVQLGLSNNIHGANWHVPSPRIGGSLYVSGGNLVLGGLGDMSETATVTAFNPGTLQGTQWEYDIDIYRGQGDTYDVDVTLSSVGGAVAGGPWTISNSAVSNTTTDGGQHPNPIADTYPVVASILSSIHHGNQANAYFDELILNSFEMTAFTAAPEPSTLGLMLVALAGLRGARKRGHHGAGVAQLVRRRVLNAKF